MKRLRFNVTGMHCDDCAASIRIVLNDVNGVGKVDIRMHQADVEFDESVDSVERIIEAIRAAGPFDVTGFKTIVE